MSATDFAYPRQPFAGSERAVKNTDAVALTVGMLVKLDTGNPMSATQDAPGVVRTAAVADYPYGFVIENIPVGGYGRVQRGGECQGIAAGAIAVGAIVGASAATAGDVTTYTAANPSAGQALTAAANAGDPIAIAFDPSKNA